MKFTAIALCGLLVLSGCATNRPSDYALYAETQQKIAQAQAMADAARYAALAEIAKQGDSAAKVAAVMSIQIGAGSGGTSPRIQPQQINPPKTFGDTALQWTSVLLPSLTNLYGISANRQVAITQSNNQAAIATSTNNTFASMNSNMAKSNTDIANAGLTATTTTAANGLTATTTTAANGLTAVSNVAGAGITGIVTTSANGLTAATNISKDANATIKSVSDASNASIQLLTSTLPSLQPITITNTTTTTNNCGSNASGGTVTCP